MKTSHNGSKKIINMEIDLNPSKSTPCKNIVKVMNNDTISEHMFNCVELSKYSTLLGADIKQNTIMCPYCV